MIGVYYGVSIGYHELKAYGPEYEYHVLRDAPRYLAEELHKYALISKHEVKPDSDSMFYDEGSKVYRFTVFVEGDKDKAQKIDDLVEKARKEGYQKGLSDLSERSIKSIDNWGSYYGSSLLNKNEAIRSILDKKKELEKENNIGD